MTRTATNVRVNDLLDYIRNGRIMDAMNDAKLQYGDMQIFHYQETDGNGQQREGDGESCQAHVGSSTAS